MMVIDYFLFRIHCLIVILVVVSSHLCLWHQCVWRFGMEGHMYDPDNYILWLTKESSLECGVTNFDIGMNIIEDELFSDSVENVSLEGGSSTSNSAVKVLHDNMSVEDFLFGECVDGMKVISIDCVL